MINNTFTNIRYYYTAVTSNVNVVRACFSMAEHTAKMRK